MNKMMKNMRFSERLLAVPVFFLLLQAAGQETGRDELCPPFAVKIDPKLNTASWEAPKMVLLTEDFNSPDFPPGGWDAVSSGKGWIRSGEEPFLNWIVPDHGSEYALSNDDSASINNNGGDDLLISPVVNLSAADSCKLHFKSYFTGAYGQSARVKYRTDPSSEWNNLLILPPDPSWKDLEINLSEFSGPSGYAGFQLAFHADDQGYRASGWALDEIRVAGSTDSYDALDYLLFWDDLVFDSVEGLLCHLPFSNYGEAHRFGICARYASGNSDTLIFDLEGRYLGPPGVLEAERLYEDWFEAQWEPPVHVPFCNPWDLQFLFGTQPSAAEGGCETDGESIFVAHKYNNLVKRFDLEGNLLESFTIPGIPGLFDLAYSEYFGLMYGSHGGNTIYVMDFNAHTLATTIPTQVPVWGLACDDIGDAFWVSNPSERMYYLGYDGDTAFSFPLGPYGNYQGLAVDNEYSGSLWGFTPDSTGALLVEYKIDTSSPYVISVVDVSELAQSSGVPGGLFLTEDFYENCKTLGGILTNDQVFGYALYENLPYNWTPPGFDSYRLYNHDTLIYSGNERYYQSGPLENIPTVYSLKVSALYNLDAFGFPGEYRESEKTGPVMVEDQYGYPLDFLENWDSLSFSEHRWYFNGQNWLVHDNLGNPYPSGVFRGITGTGPYDETLTSHWFMVDGDDSCDFTLTLDIKVQDLFPTGNQTLDIEIYDHVDRQWNMIRRYTNDTVMLDFMQDTIPLTREVNGDIFKLRFHAHGIDSKDIQFWIFDNIAIRRTCKPPEDLRAEWNAEQDSVRVTWTNPYRADNRWIHYDDSTLYTTMGFSAGPELWFDIAARWPDSVLRDLEHFEIRKLAFMPTEDEASYILKVWSGDSASTLLYEKIAYPCAMEEWYVADVVPPLKIDYTKDLWIGYSCSSREGSPVALDPGPAADGLGNLLRVGNDWITLKSIDTTLEYNFLVQAGIVKPQGHTEAVQVFRKTGNGPFQHIATTDSTYVMIASDVPAQPQCFKSRAICFNEPNMIVVSAFSNTDCLSPVGISEEEKSGEPVSVFPNPARDEISVSSNRVIDRLDIYDGLGKHAGTWHPKTLSFKINLSGFDPGVYLMKITTGKEVNFSKIILMDN